MDDLMTGNSGCLQPGMEVGAFTVMEFLGAGALGESYLSVGPSGTEDTVVHLLSPQRNSTQDMMERLGVLIERGQNIRNLHVLEFLDAQTDEFFNWVAFRRSDWAPLSTLIAQRKEQGVVGFTDKEVRRMIFQVLLALCVLHNRGILHGSLKPQHCFVDEEFRLEVADSGLYPILGFPDHFGLPGEGVFTVDIPEFIPRMNAVIESTLFAAPECALFPNFTVESDLYSVGFLAWHLFTGHRRAGANFFYELPEEIQAEWGAWFLRATEPLPENRFHSAEEMISELPGVEVVENP
ncbi:MAG: protein kinase domain-containing protein [Puniceicoccales bacterium]